MITLKMPKRSMDLSEISQEVNYRFSLCRRVEAGVYQMCHPWVKCRDYLHDGIRTTLFPPANYQVVYGFDYHPSKDPMIDTSALRLAVTSTRFNFAEEVENALHMIRVFEHDAGFRKESKLLPVKKDVYIFRGSKEWLEAPATISLYSLMIRLGAQELLKEKLATAKEYMSKLKSNVDSIHGNDRSYVYSAAPYFLRIMQNREKISFLQGYKDMTLDRFHDSGGIVGLVSCAVSNDTLKQNIKTHILQK